MWLIDKVEDCKRKVIEHRQYAEISRATGISFGWIAKFATNNIKNPGVLHIQKLDDYFNG